MPRARCHLSPCGRGRIASTDAVRVRGCGIGTARVATPHPNPLPQGERELTVVAEAFAPLKASRNIRAPIPTTSLRAFFDFCPRASLRRAIACPDARGEHEAAGACGPSRPPALVRARRCGAPLADGTA